MFILDGSATSRELVRDIERVRHLLRDLERAANGGHPDRRVIARAPVLDNWQPAFRQEPCLIGAVMGHPTITNGHKTQTSGLWLLAPAFGYARTFSRVYALGRPAVDRRNKPQS